MDVIIRKAREDELKVVQDLSHQLFIYYQKDDPSLNMDWTYQPEGSEYFKDKISERDGVCFVAEKDEKVIGYLAGGVAKPYAYSNIKVQTELENIIVLDEFRGQGVGEKLFEEFLHWSKEQNAERIKVSAYACGAESIKFYRNIGFTDYSLELKYEIKN